MEKPESLRATATSGDATEAPSSSPSASRVAVEKCEAKASAKAAAAVALQDIPEVRRSPRIAMEAELARQQKQDEKNRKALAAGTGNDSAHRSRVVTPAKLQASSPHRSHVHCTNSPSRIFPQFSTMPMTPDSGINLGIYEAKLGIPESPFGDYLERRYKEIFKQEATGPSQLPTLAGLVDPVTMPGSSMASTSIHESTLLSMEESIIKQERANPDEYAPIDLTRTNSNEIYQSLMEMEPSFKKPKSCLTKKARFSEEVIGTSPDPVDATKELSLTLDGPAKDDACMLLPMLELFESGEISLPSGTTSACDLPPPVPLQPQTTLDHLRLIHEEFSWIDHIMTIESVTGIHQCHEDNELWNVLDVLHDHSDLAAVVPVGSRQTAAKTTKATFDVTIKPQAFSCNGQSSRRDVRTQAPPHATFENPEVVNKSQSSMERQGSPFPRIEDIVAANTKQKTKSVITVKKRAVRKKPSRKPKKPSGRTAKQKQKQVRSTVSNKIPSILEEKASSMAVELPMHAVYPREPPFNIIDANKTGLSDPQPSDDPKLARMGTVKTEVSDRNEKMWLNSFKSLKAFHQHFGHATVPAHNPVYQKLFNWLKRQVRPHATPRSARHCHTVPIS